MSEKPLTALELWAVVGPFVSAVIAAILTHFFAAYRDKKNFQFRLDEEAKIAARKARRDYLLKAYRQLDSTEPERTSYLIQHEIITAEEYSDLLKMRSAAFTELNLFGDEFLSAQIDKSLEEKDKYDTSILMNRLRSLLREEYGLAMTKANYKWLEIRMIKSDIERSNQSEK